MLPDSKSIVPSPTSADEKLNDCELLNSIVEGASAMNVPSCVPLESNWSVPLNAATSKLLFVTGSMNDVAMPALFCKMPFGAIVMSGFVKQSQEIEPSFWKSNVP